MCSHILILTHSHHTHCTLHITHYLTHHTHYTLSIPYTYTDNTWHVCGTVHCTTDPQAHSKRILLTGTPSVIARSDPTPFVLSYLGLPLILVVYGYAYINIDIVYVVMSCILEILCATPQFFIFFSKIVLSTLQVFFSFFFAPLLLLKSSSTVL